MRALLARLSFLLGTALVVAAANAATLSVSPASVPHGATVTAAWSGIATPTATDWMGLYRPGTPDQPYLNWRYTNGAASGSGPFTIPAGLAPGTYELRLFANNGYTRLATSNSFTVTFVATLSVSPTSVLPGGTVTAAWSGIPAPTNDWLGLYRPGTPNQPYLSWRYTTGAASGSVPFTIPAGLAPGAYELRLFSNNGYTRLSISNSFTITPTVSGTVTLSGTPLAGVVFAATNGVTCTSSNASGQYQCTVPQGWSGSVTPALSGYSFTPASRNYSNVTTNQTAQVYAATPIYQVSGTLTLSGSPLAGVAFAATNGVTCTSSNASGQYQCAVPQGWSGSVTPSANGYSFTPASRSHNNVANNQTGQDFAAALASAAEPIFFIQVDHLNTPRLVANATGTTVWRWDQQEPFGVNVPDENPAGLGAFEFPLRFPGQYLDKETNIAYNYFRDYDPAIGRYAQSDPIGLDGGLNTYAYVGGNPISFTDPTGLISVPTGSAFPGGPALPGDPNASQSGSGSNNMCVAANDLSSCYSMCSMIARAMGDPRGGLYEAKCRARCNATGGLPGGPL